jgi:hypothetical protein
MKRFFLILLLMLLSLQFTFAAVSTYCADEAVETTVHLGHHEHSGGKTINDSPKVNTVEKKASDSDCHFCHAVFANLPVMFVGLTTPEISLPTDVAPLLLAAQHQTTPLQRPPIASLA